MYAVVKRQASTMVPGILSLISNHITTRDTYEYTVEWHLIQSVSASQR